MAGYSALRFVEFLIVEIILLKIIKYDKFFNEPKGINEKKKYGIWFQL